MPVKGDSCECGGVFVEYNIWEEVHCSRCKTTTTKPNHVFTEEELRRPYVKDV